jgi:hypothetical protein
MDVAVERNLELGADAVGARDEDRVPEASLLKVKSAAKAANDAVGARSARCLDRRLDGLDERVAGVNVDTGRGVS